MSDKHIVVSFGRSAGITKGHQKVFEKVASLAKEHNGTGHIHLSKTQDKKKNPLHHDDKVDLAKKMMPHIAHHIESDPKVKTPFHMLEKHSDKNATLHVVSGGDRVKEYQDKFDKYNGKDYHYKKIIVHNAGERNDGVSGTHLRNLATAGNFEEFKKHAPTTAKTHHTKEMYDKIRNHLMAENYMKTIDSFLLEKTNIDNVQTLTEPKEKGKRKLLSIKNKVIINPDYSTYQAKTHKDPDTAIPLDGINTNGKATNIATSAYSSGT